MGRRRDPLQDSRLAQPGRKNLASPSFASTRPEDVPTHLSTPHDLRRLCRSRARPSSGNHRLFASAAGGQGPCRLPISHGTNCVRRGGGERSATPRVANTTATERSFSTVSFFGMHRHYYRAGCRRRVSKALVSCDRCLSPRVRQKRRSSNHWRATAAAAPPTSSPPSADRL